MTRYLAVIIALLGAAWPAGPVRAETMKIKLATLAPENSAWDELLKDLQAEWSRASGGRIELRIFPGGVAGDEGMVVQKMGINNYQAALMSSHGLSTIDKSLRTLTIPRMLRTDSELERAMDLMTPELERRLEEKGYEVLFWAEGGWVKFFVPTQDPTVDEVRKSRLFSWAGDSEGLEIWKRSGFNVVPLPMTELVTSLQTNLINAFDTVPYYAVATQAYRHAPYMIDMNWTPLPGALVITKAAWDQIPDDLKPVLKQISAEYSARFRIETRKMEADAVVAMKARGLLVVTPEPQVVAEWDQAIEKAHADIRGSYVTAQDFDWMVGVAKKARATP
jgi:TRAP-type C4-dicarboxylate transport system substrate-binding protein